MNVLHSSPQGTKENHGNSGPDTWPWRGLGPGLTSLNQQHSARETCSFILILFVVPLHSSTVLYYFITPPLLWRTLHLQNYHVQTRDNQSTNKVSKYDLMPADEGRYDLTVRVKKNRSCQPKKYRNITRNLSLLSATRTKSIQTKPSSNKEKCSSKMTRKVHSTWTNSTPYGLNEITWTRHCSLPSIRKFSTYTHTHKWMVLLYRLRKTYNKRIT